MNKTFEERWAFPSQVKAELRAASYDVRPLPENFKSGRPKWEALFFGGDGRLLSRRIAMELTSKRTGAKYHVCARCDKREATARPQPQADPLDALDELDALDAVYA
jgi:hypothetical protein